MRKVVLPGLQRFLPKGTTAIALWPVIVFVAKEHSQNSRIVQHEQIHLRQQKELLVIFFYLIYLLEYLFQVVRTLDHEKAYRSISFEKEAYRFDGIDSYLADRKVFAMWRR